MSDFDWILTGTCYKLGDDVSHAGGVVPNWLISGRYTEPKDIIPHLFEETDPGFHERCRRGDIIVTGRNFGMGPKATGYIAIQALGLGLVCESMPFLAYRAAIGYGVQVMTDCPAVGEICDTGDRLEVDFRTGFFINHTRGISREYPGIPESLQDLVRLGGNAGWLRQWWTQRQHTSAGTAPADERR